MRVKGGLAFVMLLVAAGTAARAQTVRVSGTVVDDRQAPIPGATVRLTGDLSTRTAANGRFQFDAVVPGRYMLTAVSIGFHLRSIQLAVGRDTTVTVVMTRRSVTLDTMLVRPRYFRVRGTAVDSATGDYLLQAQATLYPSGKFVGARNGRFTFDSVAPGPITIIVEGMEHLPTRVDLEVSGDTTFRVKMGIDSVALRMVAMKVEQLNTRSMSYPVRVKSVNRGAIARENAVTLGQLVERLTFSRKRRPGEPMAACEILDEVEVVPGLIESLLPELVERVEIYGSARGPSMIRVYTKRYVGSLLGKETVPGVFYKGRGVMPMACRLGQT